MPEWDLVALDRFQGRVFSPGEGGERELPSHLRPMNTPTPGAPVGWWWPGRLQEGFGERWAGLPGLHSAHRNIFYLTETFMSHAFWEFTRYRIVQKKKQKHIP